MNADIFGPALLLLFVAKLLWNIVYPAVMEWRHRSWLLKKVDKDPQSFNMLMGLEILFVLLLALWAVYKNESFIFGLAILFTGALFIVISYSLSEKITKFIRRLL